VQPCLRWYDRIFLRLKWNLWIISLSVSTHPFVLCDMNDLHLQRTELRKENVQHCVSNILRWQSVSTTVTSKFRLQLLFSCIILAFSWRNAISSTKSILLGRVRRVLPLPVWARLSIFFNSLFDRHNPLFWNYWTYSQLVFFSPQNYDQILVYLVSKFMQL